MDFLTRYDVVESQLINFLNAHIVFTQIYRMNFIRSFSICYMNKGFYSFALMAYADK